MNLSARNQIIIAVAIILVLAVAFTFLGILPMFRQAGEVDAQILTANSDLQAAQALVARRQSAKANSAQNEVELMRIANQVPDSPQLPTVIIELQDVANAAGLLFPQITVGALSPGAPSVEGQTPEYSKLSITLLVQGDWADVIEFYRKLDKLDRGVRVTNSTFSYVPESETSDAYVNANIVLEVYVMTSASSTPPPAVSAPSQETSPSVNTTQTQ
jgi:type IV pilus assembly protein PilO